MGWKKSTAIGQFTSIIEEAFVNLALFSQSEKGVICGGQVAGECAGSALMEFEFSGQCPSATKTEIWNKISPRPHFLINAEVDFIHLKQGQYSIVY